MKTVIADCRVKVIVIVSVWFRAPVFPDLAWWKGFFFPVLGPLDFGTPRFADSVHWVPFFSLGVGGFFGAIFPGSRDWVFVHFLGAFSWESPGSCQFVPQGHIEIFPDMSIQTPERRVLNSVVEFTLLLLIVTFGFLVYYLWTPKWRSFIIHISVYSLI